MMRSVADFMRKDAEEELSKIVKANKDRLLRGTSLVAKAIEGYTEQVITRYAKSIHADLIVAERVPGADAAGNRANGHLMLDDA